MIQDRSITCPNCGGDIIGDGYSEVRHCEFADESLYDDKECDASIVYCKIENKSIMNKIYDNEWQRNDETITIKKDFFEHLLNCLANQKFIGELPPNGDAMAMEESDYNRVQREGQEAIDKAWKQGMFILSIKYGMETEYQKRIQAYVDFWNESIPEIMKNRDSDIKEFTDDTNVSFKWQHLVDQEIVMWVRLCCFSKSTIDVENEKYEIGQVTQDYFDYIVTRRGFTPKMISFLLKMLKHVGIGNNLKEG